jgi:enterobacterial common antigen flippase
MAFFGAYVLHLVIVYPLARRLAGFRCSAANLRTGALFVTAIGAVFTGFELLDPSTAMTLGIVATVASALWSVHALRRLVAPGHVPRRLSWLLKIGKDAR